MTLGPQRRTKLALALPALASALLSLTQAAGAQANDPPKADGSLERAQKAADAVFQWIKINADKGASRQTPAPAPAPAPAPVARKPAAAAPVAAAPRPAQAPVQSPIPAPATAQNAAASSPAPETAVAQAPAPGASEPEETPPVVLASASPTPTPAAPLTAAAQAVEPPPAPVEEEVPLKLLSKVNPDIPRQMRTQNFHKGFAQVQFTVQPDGKVGEVHVLKTSHARLGSAAMDAVRQWRFAPIPKAREAAVEIAFNSDEG